MALMMFDSQKYIQLSN